MDLNEAMIKRIEDLSIEHHTSIPRWSMKAGIIPSTLYNMMKKKSCPRVPTVKLLCDAIGITLEEFFPPIIFPPPNTGKRAEGNVGGKTYAERKIKFERSEKR